MENSSVYNTENNDMNDINNIINNMINDKILTYKEYLIQHNIAAEKSHIDDKIRLNGGELLLMYVCYLVANAFKLNDISHQAIGIELNDDVDKFSPMDIAIINRIFIKIADIGYDYKEEDRNKWLKQALFAVIETYNSFITAENVEELFANNFQLLDNLMYNYFTLQISDRNDKQRWEYLYDYNKHLITDQFFNYLNTYLQTIDTFYANEEEEIKEEDQAMETADRYI